MKAQACTFRRTQGSVSEEGIAIGTDTDEVMLIIDKEGNPVVSVPWTYYLTPYMGCFSVWE